MAALVNCAAIVVQSEHDNWLVVTCDDTQRLREIIDVQVADEAGQRDGEQGFALPIRNSVVNSFVSTFHDRRVLLLEHVRSCMPSGFHATT